MAFKVSVLKLNNTTLPWGLFCSIQGLWSTENYAAEEFSYAAYILKLQRGQFTDANIIQ